MVELGLQAKRRLGNWSGHRTLIANWGWVGTTQGRMERMAMRWWMDSRKLDVGPCMSEEEEDEDGNGNGNGHGPHWGTTTPR